MEEGGGGKEEREREREVASPPRSVSKCGAESVFLPDFDELAVDWLVATSDQRRWATAHVQFVMESGQVPARLRGIPGRRRLTGPSSCAGQMPPDARNSDDGELEEVQPPRGDVCVQAGCKVGMPFV
jgi:hypothetical protein